jgi:hypothetical protein
MIDCICYQKVADLKFCAGKLWPALFSCIRNSVRISLAVRFSVAVFLKNMGHIDFGWLDPDPDPLWEFGSGSAVK